MGSTSETVVGKRKRKRKNTCSPVVIQDRMNMSSSNGKIQSEKKHKENEEEAESEHCLKKCKTNTGNFKTVEHSFNVLEKSSNKEPGNSPDKVSREKKSKKKAKKRNKKDSTKANSRGFSMSDERLKAYGIDPKKFKYTYLKKMHEEKNKSFPACN